MRVQNILPRDAIPSIDDSVFGDAVRYPVEQDQSYAETIGVGSIDIR